MGVVEAQPLVRAAVVVADGAAAPGKALAVAAALVCWAKAQMVLLVQIPALQPQGKVDQAVAQLVCPAQVFLLVAVLVEHMVAAAAAVIGMVAETIPEVLAQFALSGPVLTVNSHLQIQGMNKWQVNRKI